MRHMCLLLVIVIGVMTGCASSARRAEGEACTATEACDVDLECVVVDNDASFCLPRPPAREERVCSVDNDCILSDDRLWPVETECLDGACRCLGAEVFCEVDDEFDEDTFSVILEEETCRCVARGNEGDACITSHTCDVGLACSSGECRDAPEQEGSACLNSDDCSDSTTCSEFRDNNDIGVCR